ncbi:hypothetical protein D3C80_1739350 [compost metagenome]
MSMNFGSNTTWQKLSCTAIIAACASRGPVRVIACTLNIGYDARTMACCKSTGPLAGKTRRGSLFSGGNSGET